MDKLILSQIPLSDIIAQLREAVREELALVSQANSSGEMISPTEVCKIFSPAISRVTLHQWTKDGRIPSNRIGGRVYYKRQDVLDAVKELKRYKK